MANLHVLGRVGAEIVVVAHVAVPNTNNAAGVNWRTVAVRSGYGGTTILPDGDGTGGTISAAEKAQIVSGALIEVVETIRPQTAGAGVNAYLDAQYTRISAETTAALSVKLDFYGYTR